MLLYKTFETTFVIKCLKVYVKLGCSFNSIVYKYLSLELITILSFIFEKVRSRKWRIRVQDKTISWKTDSKSLRAIY